MTYKDYQDWSVGEYIPKEKRLLLGFNTICNNLVTWYKMSITYLRMNHPFFKTKRWKTNFQPAKDKKVLLEHKWKTYDADVSKQGKKCVSQVYISPLKCNQFSSCNNHKSMSWALFILSCYLSISSQTDPGMVRLGWTSTSVYVCLLLGLQYAINESIDEGNLNPFNQLQLHVTIPRIRYNLNQ